MSAADLARAPFGSITDLLRAHAIETPDRIAVIDGDRSVRYGVLDGLVDRVAVRLQHDGVSAERSVAIAAAASIEYLAVFLGALRAGTAVAPMPVSATPQQIAAMIDDAEASHLFLDASTETTLAPVLDRLSTRRVPIGSGALDSWAGPAPMQPAPIAIVPDAPCNIIYSSGTTGTPKGIVQPYHMRWAHAQRGVIYGYRSEGVTLLATPLYSNTTLVSVFPTIAMGGTIVLMNKFDVTGFLMFAERYRATHTMLVPVQYQRIMAHPQFDRFDLTSFEAKFCTSAPFPAALKADILRRWPGKLFEFYGMTEGGGTFILAAHDHPDKLHTVGRAAQGHDIRFIDESGHEVAPGEVGEIVGHSGTMMTGYRNHPEQTAEAEWRDAGGKRFIRTGDLGRLDAEGFLTLLDRRKDMIISGGFNLYPSDLESILREHAAVADVAVVGVASERWGETPVAFIVPKGGTAVDEKTLLEWINTRVGKMQRLHDVRFIDALPRSSIGKVLKRGLRDRYQAAQKP